MKRKTVEKLFGTYTNLVAPFAESEAMDKIFAVLKEDRDKGYKLFPGQDELFKAFQMTPLSEVRVVIIGQDPYPTEEFASGLAFGTKTNNHDRIPASLGQIVSAVERDAYGGLNFNIKEFDLTLEHWTKQGILLLNSAFTVRENTPRQYLDLWKPFTEFVVTALSEVKHNLIWVGLGGDSHHFTGIPNIFLHGHYVINEEHPVKGQRETPKRPWNATCFSKVNATIEANRMGKLIEWGPSQPNGE